MCGAGADVFAVWGYIISHTVSSTVELNPKLIAFTIGMTPERVQAAIDYLCAPDPSSRTPDEEGRRLIKEGTFQYFVVTHEKHRAMRDEESRRENNRTRKRKQREREKSEMSQNVTPSHTKSRVSPYTEAEAEAEKEAEKEKDITEFPEIWNANCRSLPKVEKLTNGRKIHLKARIKEGLSLEKFKRAVIACTEKPHLRGENDRGWTATFDWLIENDTNLEKALNNPYGLKATPKRRYYVGIEDANGCN